MNQISAWNVPWRVDMPLYTWTNHTKQINKISAVNISEGVRYDFKQTEVGIATILIKDLKII